MQALRESYTPAIWTQDQLLLFTSKQLKQLHAYDPEIGGTIDAEAKRFFDAHPPNGADRRLAYELSNKKRSGTILLASAVEESAWQSGTRVVFTEETMSAIRPTGDVVDFHNCAIPCVHDSRARIGLYQLVGILSTFFKYNGSSRKIEMVTQMQAIEDAWGVPASVLKPSSLIQLKQMFVTFIDTVPKWKGLTHDQRAALTSARWIVWLMELFDTCAWVDYIAFHSFIAYDLLKAYRVAGGRTKKYVPIMVKDGAGVDHQMVPSESLVVLTSTREATLPDSAKAGSLEVRAVMKRDPIIVKGPLPTIHQFVDYKKPTLEKATKAYSAGMILRGGDGSGLNVISSAIGFSGMPTPLVRHQILLTSAAGFLMGKVRNLDIYCPSIGVIPLLHASLVGLRAMKPTSCDWKYITSYTDSSKVDKDYKDYVETSYRSGSHRLWVSDKVFPSKADTAALLLCSGDHLNQVAGDGSKFTYYGPLFGQEPWRQGRYVYRHGLPSGFKGFCSTFDSFALQGMKYEGDDRFVSVMVNLDRIVSDSGWYECVIRANVNRNAAFLRMGRRYSPISNVIIPPFKGVRFAMRGSDLEYAEQGDNSEFADYQSDQEVEAEYAEDVLSDETDETDGDVDDGDFDDHVGPRDEYSSPNSPSAVGVTTASSSSTTSSNLKSAMTRLPRSAVPSDKEVTINPTVEERFLVLGSSLLGGLVPSESTSSTNTTTTLSMPSQSVFLPPVGPPPSPPPPRVVPVSPVVPPFETQDEVVKSLPSSDVDDDQAGSQPDSPQIERRTVKPRAGKEFKKGAAKKKGPVVGLFTDVTVEGDLGTFAADEFN